MIYGVMVFQKKGGGEFAVVFMAENFFDSFVCSPSLFVLIGVQRRALEHNITSL
jgi:hypothetical protein